MEKHDIINNLGKTLITNWGAYCRITKITNKYFIIDFPEERSYFTNGKLMPMPQKKVYFNTTNPVWNLKSFNKIIDFYEFKMKQFKMGMLSIKNIDVEENKLPTIYESLKLVHREPRRTKSEIEKYKLLTNQ